MTVILILYSDDPVWDGKECESEARVIAAALRILHLGQCGPIPSSTTDDIKAPLFIPTSPGELKE